MKTKQSLYNITEEQQRIIQDIINAEGEITEEQEQQLAITKKSLQQKSIAYLEVKKRLAGFNYVAKAEIKRLQGLVKRNENINKRLDAALLIAVKTFGTYEVGTQKFGTRKSESITVEIEPSKLPEKYQVRKLNITADKTALKKALKDGDIIDGVKLNKNINLKIN